MRKLFFASSNSLPNEKEGYVFGVGKTVLSGGMMAWCDQQGPKGELEINILAVGFSKEGRNEGRKDETRIEGTKASGGHNA